MLGKHLTVRPTHNVPVGHLPLALPHDAKGAGSQFFSQQQFAVLNEACEGPGHPGTLCRPTPVPTGVGARTCKHLSEHRQKMTLLVNKGSVTKVTGSKRRRVKEEEKDISR